MHSRALPPNRSAVIGLMLLLAWLLVGCVSSIPDETTSPLPVPTVTAVEARTTAAQTVPVELPTKTPVAATATPTPTPAEPRNLSSAATVSASSKLEADSLGDYEAAAVNDGSLSTPWCEGAEGSGIGEWLELTFSGPVELTDIGVDVGYDRAADDTDRPEHLFTDNNRLKQATLVFSSSQQAMTVFEDVRGVQKFSLTGAPEGPVIATSIRLIIDDVYPGARFEDTCIAEIEVWGRSR